MTRYQKPKNHNLDWVIHEHDCPIKIQKLMIKIINFLIAQKSCIMLGILNIGRKISLIVDLEVHI